MKRALIIKLGAIGDAIMALPLARELRSLGFNEITWLGGSDIQSILELVPEISERVIVNERALFSGSKLSAIREVLRTWWRLRQVNADVAFVLHADRRYKLLVPPHLRSKIRVMRLGARRHHTFDYTRLAYPEHEDRELKFAPYTLPPDGERKARICIFPGGAKNAMRDDPLRRWPLENYVELCESLLASGHSLTIIGGPSDHWIEPAFAGMRAKVDWQVGTLRLPDTIQYLRQSQLAITHDTGPLHLASMADCPVVTIFGATNSEGVAPLNFKHLVVERAPKLPCQPCYDGRDYAKCSRNICIADLRADAVLAKVALALKDSSQ